MVRLRLTRLGRKKRPYYRIVAIDGRNRRDGAYIERIGYYHPLDNPPTVQVDGEKALKWLRYGAQPSDTVLSLLRKEGIWLRFRLEKRGLPEDMINKMMLEWFETQASKRKPKETFIPLQSAPPTEETETAVETEVEEETSAEVAASDAGETVEDQAEPTHLPPQDAEAEEPQPKSE